MCVYGSDARVRCSSTAAAATTVAAAAAILALSKFKMLNAFFIAYAATGNRARQHTHTHIPLYSTRVNYPFICCVLVAMVDAVPIPKVRGIMSLSHISIYILFLLSSNPISNPGKGDRFRWFRMSLQSKWISSFIFSLCGTAPDTTNSKNTLLCAYPCFARDNFDLRKYLRYVFVLFRATRVPLD